MHLKKSLWLEPVFWDNYYKKELSDRGGYSIQSRDAKYFEHYTRLYAMEAPLKILYAGCGICCLGELMAYMGNEVMAIDISGYAIRYALERKNTRDLFWHCFEWRFRLGSRPGIPKEVSYHDRKDYLKNVYVPSLYKRGGSCKYVVADWNDNTIPAESFDLILNQNGLKGCSKPEIRQASDSFYRLLKPGGLLIETVINDLEIEKTIIPEFISAGFDMKKDFISDREEVKMHALDKSQKHAVYCTLTG